MIVEMIVTLAFLAIPFSIGYQTGRKNLIYKENEGEKKVRITLQSIEEHGYHLKNNITIPTTNGSTQIDHILFSRKGIFIIETKDYKGWIYGNEKQHKWTQTFKNSQKKYKFLNPLLQNNGHIYHLSNVVGISKEWIISIVVFTNSEVEIKTNLPNKRCKTK
ncbi:nuclease-related domain-containing protein [Methylocucumis oryzae]|uniref:NERD domain-containing protein n=1 Tax=Methylocucumis oryzae TaxID=1632867 RepID=A0A0F3IG00_9GAMM|nr:nuclease-related domain-containing protein [Methylocucumis oryzae]KJV05671.1 hypothetical protein VZ94_16535 [Methylocucumis oryzae]